MAGVIEAEGLRKEYRRLRGGTTVAVAGLDLEVPQGGVFGFLGPNGSGKTTTIRCLLGLVARSSGVVRLLGAEPPALHTVIARVGSIVETPTFFPTFSGRKNLQLLAALYRLGDARVEAALERVNLADRGDDLFKNYSLGMKQRLGIAGALLKDPELLILDEPANGLDPAGIKEVRDLIRSLGDEGRTVFLSSHPLGEVQQVCDHVAILARGRCIAKGSVDEVLAQGHTTAAVRARVHDLEAGVRALTESGYEPAIVDDMIRVQAEYPEHVTQVLAYHGLYVSELHREMLNLEDVFLQLTQETPA
ncbi:MAG: ABC transporter ATP-binding protein [Actinomycetota bacterium]